jgi:hypothetical protein
MCPMRPRAVYRHYDRLAQSRGWVVRVERKRDEGARIGGCGKQVIERAKDEGGFAVKQDIRRNRPRLSKQIGRQNLDRG